MSEENQNPISFSRRTFLGVSQSDFVYQKSFTWTKTKNAIWS